jgi:DNA polymerase elongation subunit (family B)
MTADSSAAHVFQVVGWNAADINQPATDSSLNRTYTIKMYGRTQHGDSISVSINDWKPYFFIRLDAAVSAYDIKQFIGRIYNTKRHLTDCITDAKVVKRMDFWGYSARSKFHYLRLCFKTESAMRQTAQLLRTSSSEHPWLKLVGTNEFRLYESNIIPYLRFCHVQQIQPAGWVSIPKNRCEASSTLESKCKIDIQVDSWKYVHGIDKPDIAPLTVMSFDIECVSSDGDFPLAIKTYTKVANDIFNMTATFSDPSAPAWKSKMVSIVLETYASNAMIPFHPEEIQPDAIHQRLLEHAPHVWLLIHGDNSVLNHELKRIFAECSNESHKRAYWPFKKFHEKLTTATTDKKPLSAVALRGTLTKWLVKVFGGQLDMEKTIERIVGISTKEKDALVGLLGKYLDDILPRCKGDPIIQIGCTVHTYGQSQCSQKYLVSNGTCDPIPDTQVLVCHSEAEMIRSWVDLVNAIDPDIVTGYNILGFDFKFIYHRAVELGVQYYLLSNMGRLEHTGDAPESSTCNGKYVPPSITASRFVESKLSSSALGDNIMCYIDMPGRVIVDILKVVQRDHKLDSYKLDTVAEHFMKENKKDVSPNDIFRLYRGSAADRAIIGDYCVVDCELCNRLMMKLEIMANNIGMSNVCWVPLHFIFFRGQGVKIFSLVAKQAREMGFVIPHRQPPQQQQSVPLLMDDMTMDDEHDDGGYEGALVLEPVTGLHTTPVAVLDYASLYPSSMISENLSHDCLVMDPKYDNLEGVTYSNVTYDVYEGKGDTKVKVSERVCRYAQDHKGVLPYILEHLLQQRKLTRKRMTLKSAIDTSTGQRIEGYVATDIMTTVDGHNLFIGKDVVPDSIHNAYNTFQLAVLEGLQLAYKITANSLYGQQGAVTSPLYLKDIAACTTATGRNMLQLAKSFLEKTYDGKIVYGDSVTGYTPVYVKKGTDIDLLTIDTVASKYGNDIWIPCVEQGKQEKEACELHGVETWTEKGWTKLHRVIRHKLARHKRIIRVLTHTGVIDVTDDHSLLDKNGTEVTPNNVSIGFKLLHHDMPACDDTENNITKDQAEAMGFFFWDGSCGYYDCPSGKKAYDGDSKIIPSCIINSSMDVREAFWRGLYDSNGYKDEEDGYIRIDQKSQISAAYIAWLASTLGYKVSLNTRHDKCDIYRVTMTKGAQRKNPNAIKKMDEIDYTGYVYDLTTDNHHFAAGVGNLIVHNTDSVFVQFPKQTKGMGGKESLKQTIAIAQEASTKIKPLLRSPHDLEYEKTFYPLILLSKKRYVANTYGTDTEKFKRSSMGIVMKRRDNAPIVKYIYGGIIDSLLNDGDPSAAARFMDTGLRELIAGNRPLSDLVISKTLKASYKDPSKIAHKVLADRMAMRDPGNAPEINTRLPYVYIMPSGKQQTSSLLQGDRIEHVDYVIKMKLQPDFEFYITNQIMVPVLQLLAVVLEKLPGYSLKPSYWKQKQKEIITNCNPKQVVEKLQALREAEVRKLAFDPILKMLKNDPNLIRSKNERNGNRTITDFCIKKE